MPARKRRRNLPGKSVQYTFRHPLRPDPNREDKPGKPVTVMLGKDQVAEKRKAQLRNLCKAKVRIPPAGTDPVVYEAWMGRPPDVKLNGVQVSPLDGQAKLQITKQTIGHPDGEAMMNYTAQKLGSKWAREFVNKHEGLALDYSDAEKLKAVTEHFKKLQDDHLDTLEELNDSNAELEKFKGLLSEARAMITKEAERRAKQDSRPISQVIEEYVAWYKMGGGRNGQSGSRPNARLNMLNAWVKFLDLKTIQDITRGGVERVAGRWEVQNTRWRWVRALTAFCRWCLDREYLAIHPLPRVSVKYDSAPESAKRQRALTEDELNSLLEVSPQSHQLWYITAIETGFRLSELQALRVSDYDSENRAIQLQAKFTKNGKPARQFISRNLSKLLDTHVAGKEIDAKLLDILSRASPTLQKDRQRANIEKITHKGLAGWHSFRKTLRTRLDKVPGCTPKIANAIMRHSEQGDVGLANYTDLDMKLLRQVFDRTVRMSKFKY